MEEIDPRRGRRVRGRESGAGSQEDEDGGYPNKDSLTLTADAGHFRLDNFKGQVRAYDPAPKLAEDAPPPEPNDATIEPDPQTWVRI